jgi:VanZ family protein
MWRNATGLLTRGSLPRRLPDPEVSGVVAGERLPLQRRDRPGFAPGSLTAFLYVGRAYHRAVPASLVRLWLPVALWAALIFALSSVPDLGTGLGGWDTVLRKLAHTAEYAVLGALLLRATRNVALAFVLATLYAASDELHQAFVPGRHGAPLDVAIDAVGVVAGIVLWERARLRWIA